MQYKDFTGELEQESRDVSDQIEDNAVRIENALDDAIDQIAHSETAEAYVNDVDEFKTDEPLKRYCKNLKNLVYNEKIPFELQTEIYTPKILQRFYLWR